MKKIFFCVLSFALCNTSFCQYVVKDSNFSKINTFGIGSCDSLTTFAMMEFKMAILGRPAKTKTIENVNFVVLDSTNKFEFTCNRGKFEFALNKGINHCITLKPMTKILITNAISYPDQTFLYAKVVKGAFFKYCRFIFSTKKNYAIIDFDDQIYKN